MSNNNNNEPTNQHQEDGNTKQKSVTIFESDENQNQKHQQRLDSQDQWAARTVSNNSFRHELEKPNPVKPVYDEVPPQTAASWYQWPLYSWMNPLFDQGSVRTENDQPLLFEDLYQPPAHEDPRYNEQRVQVLWQEELKKAREDPEYKPNMFSVLFWTYKKRIFVGAFYRFISDGATFAQPFLLREFTTWLVDRNQETYIGWCWMVGIVLMNLLMTFSLNTAQQHTMTAFTQMANALRILIFESTLRYPADTSDAGKVLSAATVDVMQLPALAGLIHGAYVSVIVVIASVGSMFIFAGYAALIVFGIMLFTIPIQGALMQRLFALRTPLQEAGGKRVQTISELLQSVQLMKLFGWEKNYSKRIFDARSTELTFYNQMLNWRVPLMLLIIAFPYITNWALFSLQFYFEGDLLAQKALPALTVLNGIRIPLFFIPLAWSKIFDVKISMNRVAEVCSAHFDRHIYLQRIPDVEDSNNNQQQNAIEMNNVTIIGDPDYSKKKSNKGKKGGPPGSASSPGKKESSSPSPASPSSPNTATSPTKNSNEEEEMKTKTDGDNATAAAPQQKQLQIIARDLSLTIRKHGLTIIIGGCGHGKTVLLNALLGEADIANDGGSVKLYGNSRIALISQQSWIMNETVKRNITMSEPWDEEKFERVIDAAQLRSDLEILPGGLEAELGSKGLNISGGQKARVQIARAMYSDRDIVVADDPLSAVDPHVSQALFDNCFSDEGMMKGRTRILVTHQAQLVSKADQVIIMKNCQIAFAGTVEELKASGKYDMVEEVDKENQEQLRKAEEEKAKQKKKKDEEDAKKKKLLEEQEEAQKKAAAASATADASAAAAVETVEDKLKKKQDAERDNKEKGTLNTKEVDQAGVVTWKSYDWYATLGGYGQLFGMMFFACLSSGCFIMSSIILSLWAGKRPLGAIPAYENIQYMWIMAAFTGVGSFFLIFRQTFFMTFIKNVAENVHDTMVRNILRAPMTFHWTTPAGRILNRLSKDLQNIDFAIFESLQMVVNMFFGCLQALVTIIISAPYVLVIMPIIGILFYRTFVFYANSVRGLKRLDGSATSPYISLLGEVTSGLAAIRAFGLADQFKKENEKRTLLAATPAYNAKEAQRWLSATTDLYGTIVLFVAAGLGCVSRTVDTSSWLPLNPALTALAVSSSLAVTNTLTMLCRMTAEFETGFVAVERAREFSESLPAEPTYDYDEEGNLPPPGLTAEWPSKGEIEFDNVSMRYRPGLPLVLNNLSFKIGAAKRFSLVGKTGDGKSSCLIALSRLVEAAEGRILIDGRDISKMTTDDLRDAMVFILQEPQLLSGTIRSNIDPFDEHSDERIWEVLGKVNLHDRLTTFITGDNEPKKLDAKVAQGGTNFSVGQRQLLALCRAILRKRKILLADEATASVDAETDAVVQKVLREDFKNTTTIVIAHRLATIIDSDIVVVLKRGTVAEMDKPINLLQKENGIFRGMCEKLGKTQFELLRQIASGEKTYSEALGLDTVIE